MRYISNQLRTPFLLIEFAEPTLFNYANLFTPMVRNKEDGSNIYKHICIQNNLEGAVFLYTPICN